MPKKKKQRKNAQRPVMIAPATTTDILNRMRGELPEFDRANANKRYEALLHIGSIESLQLELVKKLLNQLGIDSMVRTMELPDEAEAVVETDPTPEGD